LRLQISEEVLDGAKAEVKLYGVKRKGKVFLYLNSKKIKSFKADKKGRIKDSFVLSGLTEGSNRITARIAKKRNLKVGFMRSTEEEPPPEVPTTTTTTTTATTTDPGTTTVPTTTTTPETVATLAAVGDIACASTDTTNPCEDAKVADVVDGINPDALALLGDIQYEVGSLSEFNAMFDTNWGQFSSIWKPVPGNHEYATTGASGYYSYFGSAAGDSSKGYYSFELGDWKIIALNSNCSEVACSAGSTQEQWLRSELETASNQCILAFWHHPRFSSGIHGDNTSVQPLWDALYENGAEIVLTGHDHDYERFALQDGDGTATEAGIREFVVGTGGKSIRAFGATSANSAVRETGTFGALKLTLRSTTYDWEFVPTADSSFTDSGTGNCLSIVDAD